MTKKYIPPTQSITEFPEIKGLSPIWFDHQKKTVPVPKPDTTPIEPGDDDDEWPPLKLVK